MNCLQRKSWGIYEISLVLVFIPQSVICVSFKRRLIYIQNTQHAPLWRDLEQHLFPLTLVSELKGHWRGHCARKGQF